MAPVPKPGFRGFQLAIFANDLSSYPADPGFGMVCRCTPRRLPAFLHGEHQPQ